MSRFYAYFAALGLTAISALGLIWSVWFAIPLALFGFLASVSLTTALMVVLAA